MPYPVTTAYEVDAAIAAGVAESFGEKVAVCAWGGAIYSTGYDLTVSTISAPFYVFKSIDGGLTWTAIATGLDGRGEIISDYYWDGSSSTFYCGVVDATNHTIQFGWFDMASDTFSIHPEVVIGADTSSVHVAMAGGYFYVLYQTQSPNLVPSIAYSNGGVWTATALGDGGFPYFPCGMTVDTATSDVHLITAYQPGTGGVSFLHWIVNGAFLQGPDWVAAGGPTMFTINPQRVMWSGGRLMFLARVDGDFANWMMFYSPDPSLSSSLVVSGDPNDKWDSILFAQEHASSNGKQGDLVATPTGWVVFWISVGSTGTDRTMMYAIVDDPLAAFTASTFFIAPTGGTNDAFDASFRLLDDGEYHGFITLKWTGGLSHQYGEFDNWFLNPYSGTGPTPTTILNYAF